MNYKAEEAAVKKLSRRSMTVFELHKFITDKGFSAEDADEIIELYKDYGYLNDARFSEEYIRFAYGKNYSRKRIERELRQKGVSTFDIEEGFIAYNAEFGEESELKHAMDEAMKVINIAGISPGEVLSDKIRGRIGRRLLTRGYSQSIVYAVFDKLRQGDFD